jgi:hypothetical protein
MESVAGHARGIVDAGILTEGMKLERELNAANAIIRQQQLLDEENLSLKQRIKRLQEAGDAMLNAWLMPEDSMEYSDRITLSADAKAKWYSAKEAKP